MLKCTICVNQKREHSKRAGLCFAFKGSSSSFIFLFFIFFLVDKTQSSLIVELKPNIGNPSHLLGP